MPHSAEDCRAPAPAMGASAGYGQVVHDGICAMHKLGIQVSPSPDMMAIMDAKDTLCQVAILSICSEDMLLYYTADEFATGFKKRPAFQPHGIKQSRGSTGQGTEYKASVFCRAFSRIVHGPSFWFCCGEGTAFPLAGYIPPLSGEPILNPKP